MTIDLEMSKDLSDALFNPRASSLFRPSGLDLLTADQLAAHLGVKVGWVKRQSRAGNVPSIKLGKCYRYRKADVDLRLSGKAAKCGQSKIGTATREVAGKWWRRRWMIPNLGRSTF